MFFRRLIEITVWKKISERIQMKHFSAKNEHFVVLSTRTASLKNSTLQNKSKH